MRFSNLIVTVTILVCSVSILHAGEQELTAEQQARLEKNIERIKDELGDRMLKTADEVISAHIDAIGGRAALESVRTMMYRGKNIVLLTEERKVERYYKSPGMLRQQMPGRDGFIASDGKTVKMIGSSGQQEMKQPWAVELLHSRIDGNFIDYKDRGISYEFLGLHSFYTEPTVFYHLSRTFPDGFVEELYFDVQSGLLRITSAPSIGAFRAYYEYRDTGGILFPHMWMRLFETHTPPHVFIVEEVKINEDYEDSFFTEY